jgi:hypothetical protein
MDMNDQGKGLDGVSAVALAGLIERIQSNSRWQIHKFNDPDQKVCQLGRRGLAMHLLTKQFYDRLYAREVFRGNCLLNEGINELFTLICGTGATKFDSGNAYLGVGDAASPAADPAQTGLQATTNKLYKVMDGGYPTYGSSQKGTWRSTFGGTDALWAWNEFTVANGGSDAAKNLNRKVEAKGTKGSGTTWILTLENALS